MKKNIERIVDNTDRKTRRMNALSRLLLPNKHTQCVAVSVLTSKEENSKGIMIIGANPSKPDKQGIKEVIDSEKLEKFINSRRELISEYIKLSFETITMKNQLKSKKKVLQKYNDTMEKFASEYSDKFTKEGGLPNNKKDLENDLMKIAKSVLMIKYPDSVDARDNFTAKELQTVFNGDYCIKIGMIDKHLGTEHAEYLVADMKYQFMSKNSNFIPENKESVIGINMLCCLVCYNDMKEKFKQKFQEISVNIIVSGTHGQTYPGTHLHNETKNFSSAHAMSDEKENLSLESSIERIELPSKKKSLKNEKISSPITCKNGEYVRTISFNKPNEEIISKIIDSEKPYGQKIKEIANNPEAKKTIIIVRKNQANTNALTNQNFYGNTGFNSNIIKTSPDGPGIFSKKQPLKIKPLSKEAPSYIPSQSFFKPHSLKNDIAPSCEKNPEAAELYSKN